MPLGDRTGPTGRGRMTGRGAGFCSGNNQPGYRSPGRAYRGRRTGYAIRRTAGIGRFNAYPAPGPNIFHNGPPR